MNQTRRLRSRILAIPCALAISLCAFLVSSTRGSSYVGTWSGGSYPAAGVPYPNTLEIRSNGTYLYLFARGRWHQERGTLVLESIDKSRDARLQIRGETGLLQDGYVDGLSFERIRTHR